MPIKKVLSKKFKKGYGYQLRIDRKDFQICRVFETRKQAEKIESAYMNRLLSDQHDVHLQDKVTLGELVKEHLESAKKRPNIEKIKRIINAFLNLVGKDRSVQSLRKADLMAYVKMRQNQTNRQNEKKSITAQTINREMTEIKSMLNGAWRHFAELDEYRCPRMPRLPVGDVGRSATWTDEDFEKLIKSLLAPQQKFESKSLVEQRRKFAELIIVGRLTGMRPGELRFLNRDQVDFFRSMITVTSLKGGKPKRREVPMNEVVVEIVRRRAKKGEWIFSSPDGKKPITEPYRLLRTACKRAGIKYGAKVEGGIIFYDTRRTFENEALESGHQPHAVALVLGHSVDTMVKHYLRTSEKQLKAVVKVAKNFDGILTVDSEKTEEIEQIEEKAKSA